ncbi:hypothetical protein HDU98_010298 [Podochytrium sp. JEL0797]|nr:hypothetical protein HDU98_010298 [Podochytrium sp. JEL0797]
MRLQDFTCAAAPILPRDVDSKVHRLLLNADILQGPGGPPANFNAHDFLSTALDFTRKGVADGVEVVLSVGWTTGGDPLGEYTHEMVQEMVDALDKAGVHTAGVRVTFPIRAPSFVGSWRSLRRLLEREGARNEFTLWWSQFAMERDEVREIKSILETQPFANRTYYDI